MRISQYRTSDCTIYPHENDVLRTSGNTRRVKRKLLDIYSKYKLTKIFSKLDILGLKNLSIIDNTIKHIGLTLEEFYEKADVTDPKIYELVRERNTDGIFQLESDLFKATIKEMQPTEIHDVIALTALC